MPAPLTRRVIGTAGHIDHGKTALVRALTGVHGDRLPEEKRRGITIDLGFSFLRLDDLQIGLIDVPGHERFIRNMLAGVGGIDAVLLVVAADESIKPQTREHFAICRMLGVTEGLVAITKSDLADRETLDLVRLEVDDLTRGSFLDGKAVVEVSAMSGDGMEQLRTAISKSVRNLPDREVEKKLFRLPIDRAFTMKGFGSVVTGTCLSGSLPTDGEVEILPTGARSRARNIQVHGSSRDRALAGERTSINLPDVPLDDLARGQQVVLPGTLRTTQIVTAELHLLPESSPLKEGARIRLHHFASELLASFRIVDGSSSPLQPGSRSFVQLRLESPVAALAGDRFVVRRYSPSTTIGGGVILDPHLGKLSRGTRTEIFETLRDGTLSERLEILAKLGGIHGISLADLQQRTGLRAREISKTLQQQPPVNLIEAERGARWIHTGAIDELRRKAMELLGHYFERNRLVLGIPKSELIQKLFPREIDPGLLNFLMQDLMGQKIIAISGDLVDIPGRSRLLGGVEGDLAQMIAARFAEGGLKPPPVSELIRAIAQKPKTIEGVVSYLVKTDVLVRLADGIYLHRNALAATREALARHQGETIDVGQFKELFGLSRKIAIPLLEHLDRIGATKRIGDQRKVL
ncbi:MAG TPA: selenocysteine-specific translation elongation factor [Thermoanaerobaculia bacterium]|nr:selenocysteine-specific translation elongation factor [Thermoanaerobaculia bacterium]